VYFHLVSRQAWGNAITTVSAGGRSLDYLFPDPQLGPPNQSEGEVVGERSDPVRAVRIFDQRVVITDLDKPPGDTGDAYLRLHLLSHRLVQPGTINLEGIFGVLPTVCWTSLGPVDPSDIAAVRSRAQGLGVHITVNSVDKFPPMLDYVVPSGVRVAIANRVRLGAHLAEGTTVMHEGFVNFNAGTLGASMVEGRISQGVTVGAGTDVGGGASIMGTLSGGGTEVIAVGQRCLLGANSGLGISLGDDCVVEAGLYLTAGTIVTFEDGTRAKAREMSGRSGLLFRRNSITGSVEVLARSAHWGSLNSQLHATD
jgi:2,3,4,5-tetrahydropyridine-2-carboxylate N-succinyltransferase